MGDPGEGSGILLLQTSILDPRSSILDPRIIAVLLFACSLAVSWLLNAVLLQCAPHLGLIDHPDPRKAHSRPTPIVGGLGIYAALLMCALAFQIDTGGMAPILLGLGGVLVVLGLIDDARSLSWQPRLAVQLVVSAAAVFLWPIDLSWPLRLLAILWVVGLTNAFNMLDNMDALSASVAWVAAGFLALALIIRHATSTDFELALLLLLLMGALSGFHRFNRPPARIFMGDAGSTFLGYFLGLLSMDVGLRDCGPTWAWAVPVCILAVPCYDLVTVVALRLWQRRSPFHADKQHLSHRLVDLGLSPTAAVRVTILVASACGFAAIALYYVSEPGAGLIVGQLACWWLAVAGVEYLRHYRKSGEW